MRTTLDETHRRRAIQMEYNKKHNITPKTIIKNIFESMAVAGYDGAALLEAGVSPEKLSEMIADLEKKMYDAALSLNFEEASACRDQILALGGKLEGVESPGGGRIGPKNKKYVRAKKGAI
jgi:excinuclease ABC subunit B